METLPAGALIAERYQIERPLGRGGAGAAYLCRDREGGGAQTTVKLLASDAPGAAATLRAEFRLLVRLRHPHLVHVIDVGVDRESGRPYYAARFADGTSLAEAGTRWSEVVKAMIDACAALAHMHALGLRHGDVKPDNVVVGPDGRGTLIDLGAATPFGPLEVLSGTPGFLAPELLAGEPADQRADLYAVGVTLARLRARVSGAPAELGALVERLCRPLPADRPADARTVIAALGGEPESALPVVVPSHLVGRARELAAIRELAAAVAAGRRGPRVLWFVGPDGVGRSRLLEEALGAPGVKVVDDAHALTPEARARLKDKARRLAPDAREGLVVASRDEADGIEAIRLAPLADQEMQRWLGEAFAPELVKEVVRVAGGLPGVAARLAAAAARGEIGIGRLGERAPEDRGGGQRGMAAEAALAEARAHVARGEHREAVRMAARCLRARAGEAVMREARAVAGEAYARVGDVKRADKVLGRLGSDARVANQLAIALIKQGAYGRAAEVAEAGLEGAGPALAAELSCDLALAASYLGDAARARREIERAVAADAAPAPRTAVRIAAAAAMIEYRAGNPVGALPGYRRALDLAVAHGLDDSAVNQAMNYGATSHQIGDWGQALAAYERGLRVAAASGMASARARLLHNLGALHADIGQLELAEDALARAIALADEQALDFVAGSARLLAAEVARAGGRSEPAGELLAAAEAILGRAGAARELCEIEIERAALALAGGQAADAGRRAEAAAGRATALGARDLVARAQLWLGRARLADGAAREALAALELAAGEAERASHRLLQAEIAEALAAAAAALGAPHLARSHRERALALWERLAATLPETFREPFREQHAGAGAAAAPAREPADPAGGGPTAADWKRLVLVNRRLNSAMTTDLVLREALDAALDVTGGERGFLILAVGGALEVPVARNIDREQIGRSHLKFSRSIAESVVASGAPVVAVDAGADQRFAGNESVHAMRLQSVLCVPITAPGGVIGAVYIDNRFRRGGFGERELELLAALADQAALALTRARLTDELAARTRELEEERRQVDALMQKQQSEIVELEEELGRTRMLAVRHDYSELVGASGALRQVLATLDRVTDSDITVLIRGESGTGKELAARALHRNGPRAGGPFAALNCGALPESLLEAELFGHEKGAFTGAGAARPGLFAAARGGTVFLDELGEMTLAMQVKLLRVLQEREVRPLGSNAVVAIDVRVVCATNRDLEAEVAASRFREDLYYRIAVVTVEMPPLRRRLEDMPLLADAILARVARELGREPLRLSAAALRALLHHDWPGNVRELENALTKACLMAEGREIRPRDLALPQAAPPRSRRRGAVGRREILAALEAHGGNASRAAVALGIGRATLYRKLGPR